MTLKDALTLRNIGTGVVYVKNQFYILDKIKLGLYLESIEWKRILGKLLSHAYKERVVKMMQFINDRMKTMGKKIKDLDDVRVQMLCLALIREEFIG